MRPKAEEDRDGGEKLQRLARFLRESYIDKGKLGIDSGEGFYSYRSR
jgi:3-hydroxybutyryl-CoA dehydrogenase